VKIRTRLIAAILLMFVLTACDGGTHLKGSVSDSSGVPIQGANVTLIQVSANRSVTTQTRADGTYSVGMLHPPSAVTLKLVAEKEGYSRFEKQFSSHDHSNDIPVTLHQVAH
jgi:hypothetical protein